MKTKISYIILSALTLSLITGITPASAKTTRSAPAAPAPRVAYVSSPPAKAAAAPAAKAAAAPAAKAAAAPAVIAKPPVSPPVAKSTVLPSLLANYSSPVTKQATATTSYSTFSYGGPASTAATTSKAVQPKISTFTPTTTTLPRIGATPMGYVFTAKESKTVAEPVVSSTSTIVGNNTKTTTSTITSDFINKVLVSQPKVDPKKTTQAATIKSMEDAGFKVGTLSGGTIKPVGAAVQISKDTSAKYNATSKLDSTANKNEILANVKAVKAQGGNTLVISSTADSTGNSAYNLGLSQARAEKDLSTYAITMEKNGYSSKDGTWKDASGKTVSASQCTSSCTFTKKGETEPSIKLLAQGLGEVTTKSPGILGEKQKEIVAAGCSNSRAGNCGKMHDQQRVSMVAVAFDSSLRNKNTFDSVSTVCTFNCFDEPPPPKPVVNKVDDGGTNGGSTVTSRFGGSTVPNLSPTEVVIPTTPQPGGTTTTSRLPSGGGVTGGSTATPTSPSGAGSTIGSGPSSSAGTGTPTSGVSGTSSSTSSGSSLLPPASGFGSTPATGGPTSTPTTTGGSTSSPTAAPKFKVS